MKCASSLAFSEVSYWISWCRKSKDQFSLKRTQSGRGQFLCFFPWIWSFQSWEALQIGCDLRGWFVDFSHANMKCSSVWPPEWEDNGLGQVQLRVNEPQWTRIRTTWSPTIFTSRNRMGLSVWVDCVIVFRQKVISGKEKRNQN